MHAHLPSLLTKASSLLPHIVHFFRHFVRFIDVGLLSTQAWLGIRSRKQREEGEIDEHAKTPNRLACPRPTLDLVPKLGELVQPDLADPSLVAAENADQRTRKNLIISVHIPKTGGTTFVEVLRKCAQEVLYLDYSQEGGLGSTALFRRGKRLKAPFESVIDDLESLQGRSVIHGHFAPKKYSGRFPNATYVTWLRDPAERVVSHYFYWQRSYLPGDARWEQVVMQKMTLEQFARLDFARDVYFRWFSPLGVERFDFVGIMEEYDRSLELFRRLFCPDIQLDTTLRNYNPNRGGNFYDLGPELRRRILELNQRDTYVYLDGVRRFRSLCAQVGI
jgi:Sulfotransferase family